MIIVSLVILIFQVFSKHSHVSFTQQSLPFLRKFKYFIKDFINSGDSFFLTCRNRFFFVNTFAFFSLLLLFLLFLGFWLRLDYCIFFEKCILLLLIKYFLELFLFWLWLLLEFFLLLLLLITEFKFFVRNLYLLLSVKYITIIIFLSF